MSGKKRKSAGSQFGIFELALALSLAYLIFFSGWKITIVHGTAPAPPATVSPDVASTATPGEEYKEFVSGMSENKTTAVPIVTPHPLPPVSDSFWSKRPELINDSALETIMDAASMESGCIGEYIYATWETESGETDCEYWLTQDGPNPCISSAGARGPLQFMGAWNEEGISEPEWSIGNLHDSARAACRMWTKMELWSHLQDSNTFSLRFSSLDVYNTGRIPKYWSDRAWNVGQTGYNQALSIYERANNLIP